MERSPKARLLAALCAAAATSAHAAPTPTWTRCAAEGVPAPGDICIVPSRREVRYGVPGAYTIKLVEKSIKCDDGAFGVTVPTPYQNFCEYSSVAAAAARPGSAPASARTAAPTASQTAAATVAPTAAPTPAPTPAPTTASTPAVLAGIPVVAPGTWGVIGSSSAMGIGPSLPANAWARRLQADVGALGVTINNLALGGATTYQGLPLSAAPVPGRRVPHGPANIDAALSLSPKLVLVAYPHNDTAEGHSVDETVQNILAIRAYAAVRGVAVLVQGTQPRNLPDAQRALLAQIDNRLATLIGACFVEVRSAVAAADGRIGAAYDSGDGVHLNDAGHALIFARIKAVLDAGSCVKVR